MKKYFRKLELAIDLAEIEHRISLDDVRDKFNNVIDEYNAECKLVRGGIIESEKLEDVFDDMLYAIECVDPKYKGHIIHSIISNLNKNKSEHIIKLLSDDPDYKKYISLI